MEQLGITAFDIIAGVILLLSIVVALSRGFITEVLSIAAWIGAAVVVWYGYAPLLPVVKDAIPNDLLAEAATIIVLFLVPLIVFRVITGIIANGVSGGRLGGIDRLLGLVFGAARGALLVVAGYMILSVVIAPDRQPEWVQTAYSMPYVKEGADWLERYLPEDLIERSTEEANRAIEGARDLRDETTGYSEGQNQLLDQIIDSTQDTQ
jgi:membrane protein required for colicin V production